MAKAKKADSEEKAPAARKRGGARKAAVETAVLADQQTAPAEKAAPVRRAAARKAGKPAAQKAKKPQSLRKKYLKNGTTCMVTFMLPKAAAPDAESVCVLGEFNNWSADANRLQKLDDGVFSVTVELEAGRSYRFRYMIDGWKYENDWNADRYEPNPYGGEDSVVDV